MKYLLGIFCKLKSPPGRGRRVQNEMPQTSAKLRSLRPLTWGELFQNTACITELFMKHRKQSTIINFDFLLPQLASTSGPTRGGGATLATQKSSYYHSEYQSGNSPHSGKYRLSVGSVGKIKNIFSVNWNSGSQKLEKLRKELFPPFFLKVNSNLRISVEVLRAYSPPLPITYSWRRPCSTFNFIFKTEIFVKIWAREHFKHCT